MIGMIMRREVRRVRGGDGVTVDVNVVDVIVVDVEVV